MPEVIFPDPKGRLEGRLPSTKRTGPRQSPCCFTHTHNRRTMNHKVVYNMHYWPSTIWVSPFALQLSAAWDPAVKANTIKASVNSLMQRSALDLSCSR